MRLFTIAKSQILILLFQTASIFAQTPFPTPTPLPPLNYLTACSKCIVDSAISISPTCTIQSFTAFPSPHTLTDTQKLCYCPLTSSDAWITYCIKPELCNAVSVNALFRGVAALRIYACPTAPITTTTTHPESSSDVARTTSAFYPYQPNPYPPVPRPTSDILSPSGPTNGGLGKAFASISRVVICMNGVAVLGAFL
jgi:hypothetical protein